MPTVLHIIIIISIIIIITITIIIIIITITIIIITTIIIPGWNRKTDLGCSARKGVSEI
jgi:hypothetical protein